MTRAASDGPLTGMLIWALASVVPIAAQAAGAPSACHSTQPGSYEIRQTEPVKARLLVFPPSVSDVTAVIGCLGVDACFLEILRAADSHLPSPGNVAQHDGGDEFVPAKPSALTGWLNALIAAGGPLGLCSGVQDGDPSARFIKDVGRWPGMSVWMLTPTLTGRYRQPLVDCVFLAHPRSEGVGSALVLLVGKGECLPDQSSAIGDFLKTNLSAPGDWLVVAGPLEGTGGLSGFRVKLPTAGPLLLQVGTTVTPFGNRLLEKEVDAWLKRIVDASVSPSPPIDFTLDPLPSANRTDPLALMTRWLLAAVQRFSVPLDEARSKNASEALEWMIRQELVLVDDGNPERRPLGGTLFRRERMISDSSWK